MRGFIADAARAGVLALLGLAFGVSLASAAAPQQAEAEQRASSQLDAIRDDPLALRAFLVRMPKGGDLHIHLSGAVYAETHIRAAIDDGLCLDPEKKALVKPKPQAETSSSPPVATACATGNVPAASLYQDPALYNEVIDAFSMRGFVPSEGVTGHDHFFGTFKKFGGTNPRHVGAWMQELAARAASQNEQYLELMATPTWHRLDTITNDLDWTGDLDRLREELIAKNLLDDIPAAKAFWDRAETERRERGSCGKPDEAPGCKVQLKYMYEIFRSTPKPLFFAQALFAFAFAAADPRVVGVNIVGQEDEHVSMTDYAEHMRIIGYLRERYPDVHVSLHAGELAPGLVPPDGLCCHIRLAVEQANADRIGHGVDVMYEERPYELLEEMARRQVLVEIALTSNDLILGVKGKKHPFATYRKFGVPLAIATDDEGISRIDLTHEYVRAVQSYGLSYTDLKQIVRNSLAFSFLPGENLWEDRGRYARIAAPCATDVPGGEQPSPECGTLLKRSEKAAQQWELERRFRQFEASF